MQLQNSDDGQYLTFATCNVAKYPSILLRLEDTWFELKPSTFILEKPTGVSGDYCPIAITSSGSNDVVLGLVFLKNYYMIFDFDNDNVGISTNKYSLSSFYEGPAPSFINFTLIDFGDNKGNSGGNNNGNWYDWIFNNQTIIIIEIIILSVLVISLGGFLVWYYFLKDKWNPFNNQGPQQVYVIPNSGYISQDISSLLEFQLKEQPSYPP